MAQYAHPTGLLVTGRCNRDASEFTNARAGGADILAYLNVVERNDGTVCGQDNDFYGGLPGSTPLWPYPTPGQRSNWPGTHMIDLQAGSAWADRVVDYIANLMVQDRIDGVFLDALGGRLWSDLADWESWPQLERDRWTAGAVDLVRRLDEKRRALNPRFIIVNNNVWKIPDVHDGTGDDPVAIQGERYVDGICLEHFASTSPYHTAVAGRAYSNLGHRRVIAIATSTAEAQAWATVQGVTHVTDQHGSGGYGQVTPPPVGFHRLTDRPKTFGRTTIGSGTSNGMTSDQKRASRFTLDDPATLLGFSAYLDGGGTGTGSQDVRMALYTDSGGLPATLVAQSNNVVSIAAGSAPRWVKFTAPATALNPGQYWITIHTGGSNGVARLYRDGADNRYNSPDLFADGPATQFGSGWTDIGTISVNASYTVGR